MLTLRRFVISVLFLFKLDVYMNNYLTINNLFAKTVEYNNEEIEIIRKVYSYIENCAKNKKSKCAILYYSSIEYCLYFC